MFRFRYVDVYTIQQFRQYESSTPNRIWMQTNALAIPTSGGVENFLADSWFYPAFPFDRFAAPTVLFHGLIVAVRRKRNSLMLLGTTAFSSVPTSGQRDFFSTLKIVMNMCQVTDWLRVGDLHVLGAEIRNKEERILGGKTAGAGIILGVANVAFTRTRILACLLDMCVRGPHFSFWRLYRLFRHK